MYLSVKKSFFAVVCVGLLLSNTPVAARNTPMMVGGIGLAGCAGLVALSGIFMQEELIQYNTFWGCTCWANYGTEYDKKMSVVCKESDTAKYWLGEDSRSFSYEDRIIAFAKDIKISPAQLKNLTLDEYLYKKSKLMVMDPNFDDGYHRKLYDFCTPFIWGGSLGSLAGIALAIKGYQQA